MDTTSSRVSTPTQQASLILRVAFTIVSIVAGRALGAFSLARLAEDHR